MRALMKFALALTPFTALVAADAKNNPQCQSPFHVMHVDVRHTESKGVGYKDGYTTLEGFGIYDHNPCFMPFLDLRGHVFNDGKLAGNVGLGERTVIPSINHIFGLYLYYDVRQEDHGLTVNQLSPGIEMLGKRMEYRINAYFPVGNDESHSYRHRFDRFDGNRIILKSRKKFAMTGVDAEVGAHITQSTRHDFYFGIGPYYFTADPNNAWGGKTRLYWRYKDYVSLEASYSYDHIFKNIVQGSVAFSYPFGPKLKRSGRNCPNSNDLALSRAAFAPYRFEIPVVETRKQHRNAINPATGQPWRVWFVRNTSSSNGTYESPFSTLVAAQNASGSNDMIYVFQGDGTTRGMNAGITLKNGQALFGSGTDQTISTSVGRIKIPAQTARAPTITSSADVIFLANGNEISGMNIQVSSGPGINTIDPIIGANIHHNMISNGFPCINMDASGAVNITNNLLTGAGNGGIFVNLDDRAGRFLQANISNNTITGDFGAAVLFSVTGAPTTPTVATCNVVINSNLISGFGNQAISISKGAANSTFQIINNTIRDTISTGATNASIFVSLSNPTDAGRYLISNNTIVATTATAGTNGILLNNAVASSFAARFNVTNNTITVSSGNGSYGLNMNAAANETFCTSITNNRITLQAATGTTGMSISGGTGIVNIDDFSNNIAPSVIISGNVNLVPQNTCAP